MTAEHLEELLKRADPHILDNNHEDQKDAIDELHYLAPSLARRVIAAEKLADEVEKFGLGGTTIVAIEKAVTAYREASK